ncbi:endonuclease 8-like 1 isoform X2 [Hypanus sabinus]|uniref:endonuclease 8-like 1 isoform X2 n=1 Tax=Hypanus sabinus TaxID=79690 RepID=UPI0028C408D1|nr:endonuclease 8-like 1 isoform X2 [Hypanus sabinus]
MPEGPELHLASKFVNRVCGGLVFSGSVEKSAVSKNCEVPFQCDAYIISAVSRGKEVKLTLAPIKEEDWKEDVKCPATEPGKESPGPVDIVFRFGMSGSFELAAEEEVPKHAHLRQNVLSNLSDKAFDKPICEALLNQKYFNGIGNYLRAEILFRLKVPPFEKARTVLEALLHKETTAELTLSKKIKMKLENPDILELCHLLPMEVINLGGEGYKSSRSSESSAFSAWLRCYEVVGMQTLRDGNSRTIWFQGNPGPLAPKGSKVRKAKSRKKGTVDENVNQSDTPKGHTDRKRKGQSEQQITPEVSKDLSKKKPRRSRAAGKQAEGTEACEETRRRSVRARKKSAGKSPSLPEAPAVAESLTPKTRSKKSRNKSGREPV